MYLVNAQVLVGGEAFSPSRVPDLPGLALTHAVEPGSIGNSGRHKGKVVNYGSATIQVELAAGAFGEDSEAWRSLPKSLDSLRSAGATSIVLHYDVAHDGQCNLAFHPTVAALWASLGIEITMSCYEDRSQFPKEISP